MLAKLHPVTKKEYKYVGTNRNRHPQVVNDCINGLNKYNIGYVFNRAQLSEVLFVVGYERNAINAVTTMLITNPEYSDDLVRIRYLDEYRYEVIRHE